MPQSLSVGRLSSQQEHTTKASTLSQDITARFIDPKRDEGTGIPTAMRYDARISLQELEHRLRKLELENIQKTKAPDSSPALIAALAVIGAAFVGFLTQYYLARREDKRTILNAQRALALAKQQTVFENTQKILEFRLKQLEMFYAPMFALLQQSAALYDKMSRELAQEQPNRYRRTDKPDPDGICLYLIAPDRPPKPFRLLDQMPVVKNNTTVRPLIDLIMEIGEKITKIIGKNAGLASSDLMGLLAEYLAHYAQLAAEYKSNRDVAYEPLVHKTGYYPRKLTPKVEEGYRELSKFIDDYAKAGTKMLENIPTQQ